MKHVVLLTAKGNNTTISNKNIVEIGGKPALYYPIEAAKKNKHIDHVFVSTECPFIKEIALTYGAEVLDRPKELAAPDTNHGDVIIYESERIKEIVGGDIATVTILLGNMVMITGKDIEETIDLLALNPEADSAMTVWKAQDDHPYRALAINSQGYLEAFLKDLKPDTNRQSYPDVYFYNQGPWTVRYSSLMTAKKERGGPGAWWWMGPKSLPIIKTWVTGRDFHGPMDLWVSECWLKGHPEID